MSREYKRECNQEIDAYYDEWYKRGYMDEWPNEKKQRVFEVIRSLKLPEKGEALDFGCGNGEFTGVLNRALPKWNVYGADISSVAVENSAKRHPNCSFLAFSEISTMDKKFDFLFSHHVLEHVDDIDKIWKEINRFLKKESSMLHILPCGNQGSLEYKLCLLKRNGIEADFGNRFYFEARSHLRRLNTKQMNDFGQKYNFKLEVDFYSNHLYGALDWITSESLGFIFQMTNPKYAQNTISALKLIIFRFILLSIKCLRFPANKLSGKNKEVEKHKNKIFFVLLLLLYPFSKITNTYLKHMLSSEWKNKRCNKSGSEMYLYYSRS